MRSKTSYFNPTLFKKNLARFWPLWGGVSVIGALIPLYALTELIQDGFRSHVGEALEVTLGYYYALAYFVPIFSLFYAALCALAVWHYLYNARSVGLYHSLPITRKGLFITNFLSGMAMMLIPYVAAGLLAVIITMAAGLFDPVGVLITILGVIGESFFYFSAATAIIFVTGNPFAFAAFYFIFHFFAACMEWLVTELMNVFYFGVNLIYQGVTACLSPTIYFWENIHAYPQYVQIPTADGWTEPGDMESVTLLGGWVIAVYALIGVVLLGCAWALYQRRRSESAGDVVAVGWMKPVFRYGVALCAALSGGALLYVLFCESFQSRSTAAPIPMAICMAIAGVTGYYIASMLLAKSLKVFRRSGRGLLTTVIASMAVCFLIAADPFRVAAWVPDAGDLTGAGITVYSRYGRNVNADLTDPAAVQKLLELHQAIIDERNLLDHSRRWDWDEGYADLHLIYYQGDRYTHRYYTLSCTEEMMAQSKAFQLASELVTLPAVQEDNIFSELTTRYQVADSRLTGGYVGDLYDAEAKEINGLDLTLEQARELEAAIHRDIQAGHFGRTAFITNYEEYQKTACFGDLQLNYNVTRKYDDHTVTDRGWTISLGISTYCTETLKALEDMGVIDSTHKLLTQAERDTLEDSVKYGQDYYPEGPSIHADDGSIIYADGTVIYPEDSIAYPAEVY